MYDNECLLFIDCKLKKLTIDAILETKLDRVKFDSTIDSIKFGNRKSVEQLISMQDSPLVKDILEIGIDLGKILCCCEDWKNGKIPSLPPFTKNYQIKAIVLTLEETFCGHFIIKEMVDKVAFKYVLDKKKSFPQNVKTSIISSSTFDNSIPLISKYGIYNHVFEDNFEYKEGKNESNEFLSMKFDEFFE